MIETLFLPFDLSLLAKINKFEDACIAGYTRNETFVYGEEFFYADIKLESPTYQQIVDWFREEHNIVVFSEPCSDKDGKLVWCGRFGKLDNIINSSFSLKMTDLYNDYYESFNNAIEEAFKLI